MRILGRHTLQDEGSPICAEGGAMCTQTVLDGMQHDGYVFTSAHQNNVGSGNTISMFFTVADSSTPGHVHFGYEVTCESQALVQFYENPTRTANTGNATTPICVNRHHPRVSAWGSDSVYKDATINIVPATLLDIEMVGNRKQAGGLSAPLFNWFLGRGKNYCVLVTDESNGANEITIRLLWGRHVEVI